MSITPIEALQMALMQLKELQGCMTSLTQRVAALEIIIKRHEVELAQLKAGSCEVTSAIT